MFKVDIVPGPARVCSLIIRAFPNTAQNHVQIHPPLQSFPRALYYIEDSLIYFTFEFCGGLLCIRCIKEYHDGRPTIFLWHSPTQEALKRLHSSVERIPEQSSSVSRRKTYRTNFLLYQKPICPRSCYPKVQT